ncbi:MAG TPA: hypothetical protein VKP30_28340 [Polyangiaceae bacterium]|nr:hypothetical protein [Polyangiaceae bacterium]
MIVRKSPPDTAKKETAPPTRVGTPEPKLKLGQVGFLEVTDVVAFGAFVDWGLPKELLVPLANQVCEMKVGHSYAIGVVKDDEGRFAGTQRVTEMLRTVPPFAVGDWVEGQAWRRDPKLGVFVIVEKQYLGLLPESEPHQLKRGTTAKFRVSQVLLDGKIQLSLRRTAFEELDADAQRVLECLKTSYFRVSDDTDPEIIRTRFGLSKKAYKRAVGRLLKRGSVALDDEGYVVIPKA